MMGEEKPDKLKFVLDKVNECIETGNYILTKHAIDRQIERIINLPQILHVLKTGYEEKRKTCFDKEHNTWKYAIRGKTIGDELDVRVIVAFDEDEMLVITVIRLGGL